MRLIGGFGVFLGLFFLFVSWGERGGEKFFDNLKLTIPGLMAGGCGVAALITGLTSIVRKREGSVLVWAATAVGFLVTNWILGEIFWPH